MSFRDAHALDWGGVYKQTNTQKLISNPNLLTSPPFSSLVLSSSIHFLPTTLMDSNHISQINHTSTQFGQNVLDLGTFSKRIRSKCFDIVAFWRKLFEMIRSKHSSMESVETFRFYYFLTKVVWNDSIWILFVRNASIWIFFWRKLFEVFQTWCFLKNTV
jgi:hypothetical protein